MGLEYTEPDFPVIFTQEVLNRIPSLAENEKFAVASLSLIQEITTANILFGKHKLVEIINHPFTNNSIVCMLALAVFLKLTGEKPVGNFFKDRKQTIFFDCSELPATDTVYISYTDHPQAARKDSRKRNRRVYSLIHRRKDGEEEILLEQITQKKGGIDIEGHIEKEFTEIFVFRGTGK